MVDRESAKDMWERLPREASGEVQMGDTFIDAMETLILEGNTKENAARVVGLTSRTMAQWLTRGLACNRHGAQSLRNDERRRRHREFG